MDQRLVPVNQSPLAVMGQVANEYAQQNVFSDYQRRIAPNTLSRQKNDLTSFSAYLAQAGVVIDATDLLNKPEAWQGMTFGLVEGFVRWMLVEGFAIGTINVRLATIKQYCKLCAKAKTLEQTEYALIKLVVGYRQREGKNVDQIRETTRKSTKKADWISISKEQAIQLKSQPNTPQGIRDAFLMCLLLDHGLRCGEIAGLLVTALSITDKTLKFYREKVDKEQTHELTKDSLLAATRYLETCQPTEKLLLGSRKGGKLQGAMTTRAITGRVMLLGKRIGLAGLSAHDCRHYWATSAVRGGTGIKALQDAGGWSSPVMPLRYAESGKIANEGVKLG